MNQSVGFPGRLGYLDLFRTASAVSRDAVFTPNRGQAAGHGHGSVAQGWVQRHLADAPCRDLPLIFGPPETSPLRNLTGEHFGVCFPLSWHSESSAWPILAAILLWTTFMLDTKAFRSAFRVPVISWRTPQTMCLLTLLPWLSLFLCLSKISKALVFQKGTLCHILPR